MTDPVRHRDAVTGEFETAQKAAENPATSLTESLHDSELARAARALVDALIEFGDVNELAARTLERFDRLVELL